MYPNNICVIQVIVPDGRGDRVVYCVSQRYNYTQDGPDLGDHRLLSEAVEAALRHGAALRLPVYCSVSLANREACVNAGITFR